MTPQQSIAHYRVTTKLGEGGMGAVYRATDTKLARDVAVKILPDAFAADPDRLARFTREAQVLASLNHPNIAAIYGVEDRALILELVEGPTLADRIAQGPIPLDEALSLARQIADALEYAHEKGIVHRDLKPANIKITPEGVVKVLDFGLAKAISGDAPAGDPAASPTLTMNATMAGVILGTAAYMSPEQAKGKAVDKRADIWAFGAVVYEMLTGEMLFAGDSVSDTLASVLRHDPDFARVPPPLRRLLRSCLERDPRKRLRDIGDAWRLVEESPVAAAPAPKRRNIAPWIAAGLMAIVAAALAVARFEDRPVAAPVVRFSVPPPDKGQFGAWLALSPDGRSLAFPGRGADGKMKVWIRSLDSLELRPLAGTDGASTSGLFWSPDSRTVVFQSVGRLRKIDIAGGPPQTLCDASNTVLGGVWSRDGFILYGSNNGPLLRIPAAGGDPSPVTALDSRRGDIYHTDPILLPDGRHFLYFRHSASAEYQGLYAGTLDAKPGEQSQRRILPINFSFAYAPPRGGGVIGRLLYLHENALMAQSFDSSRLELTGDAVPLGEGVGTNLTRAFLSVSNTGALAWRAGGGTLAQFDWIDREGRPLGNVGEPGQYSDVALSPDGSRLAYSRMKTSETLRQVWILDLARNNQMRLTFAPQGAWSPAWSPDGRHLAFSLVNGRGVFVQDANGGGEPRRLVPPTASATVNQWSPDGRYVVYTTSDHGFDLMAVANPLAAAEPQTIPLVDAPFNESHGQVSPDSRWLAYNSDESGRSEIYVRPFPPGDGRSGRWLVSSSGGMQPRWRRDGKELYYVDGEQIMAVDVKTAGASFEAATPHALFTSAGIFGANVLTQYDVSADGRKFLIVTPVDNAASAPITVTLNWEAALKP